MEQLRTEVTEQARLLGISAEKELALRAENERLKAELKSIDGALDDPRANLTLTTAEIIWEIKAELAEKEAEILKLNQMYPATAYTVELEKQLAVALAACEAKDAALESLISHTLSCEQRLDEFHGLGNDSGSGCSIELCNASTALAINPDASALRQRNNARIEKIKAERYRWIPVDVSLPPDETPVLILRKGEYNIGERRWEHPSFEDTFKSYWYWDNPTDDGQEWEREDVTHWMPLPDSPATDLAMKGK
jgi:hypothetical protein